MKRFKYPSQLKKAAILSAVSLVALTGLVTGNATSESTAFFHGDSADWSPYALQEAIAGAESMPNSEELHFLESFGTLDEKALAEALAKWKESFAYTEKGGLKANNAFCERFIDQDGNYGIYGKVVAAYFKEKLKENRSTPMLAEDLVGMEDAPKICTNWREFDEKMRIKFWTWTFAAIASLESSCGADAHALKGVRGVPVYSSKKDAKGNPVIIRYKIAIGLLQMEKAKKDRAWRDITSCNVSETDIGSTYHNLRCGMDIMEGLISGNPPAKNPWPIYPGKGMKPRSYWLKLRAVGGGSIGELIRSFKPCNEKLVSTTTETPEPSPSSAPFVFENSMKYLFEGILKN